MRRINLDIALGILIGLAASIVFASPWHWEHGLKDYQELLAGGMALVGAAAAVIAVMRQINHAQEVEDDRRYRSMLSARTVMPQALSVLCAYAKECGAGLREVVNDSPPEEDHRWGDLHDRRFPSLPESPIPVLRECAQFGDKDLQLSIAKLAQTMQVQAARLNPLDIQGEGFAAKAYFYDLIDDALEVYVRASMLFYYARMETEKAPTKPMLSDMRNAAKICGFELRDWAELEALLIRRYPAV